MKSFLICLALLILPAPALAQTFKAVDVDEYNQLLLYRSMYLRERKEKIKLMQFADSLHRQLSNKEHMHNKIKNLNDEIFRMDNQVIALQEMLHKKEQSWKNRLTVTESELQRQYKITKRQKGRMNFAASDVHLVMDGLAYSIIIFLIVMELVTVNY